MPKKLHLFSLVSNLRDQRNIEDIITFKKCIFDHKNLNKNSQIVALIYILHLIIFLLLYAEF